MEQTRRERQYLATQEEIKGVARRLMAEHGTAGLSTRMIAREMGLTAPALYHYFASRDELITALIVDAFNALADALELARDRAAAEPAREQLTQTLLTYRQWAIEHPIDFQMIYGNPIPGYEAPRELTVPAAARGFMILVPLAARLMHDDNRHASNPAREGDAIPQSVQANLTEMRARDGYDVPLEVLYGAVSGWTRLHGIIMLELFHHLQPIVGDVDAFYRAEIESILSTY
ncbi:MAG TPA: TetR/AcrR family transcriptional regulator [Ktedonobacteraceae bacterium]|nr:TetR/AcrR family transcriptional regulator [Ktedonobacteraceae bacterium]